MAIKRPRTTIFLISVLFMWHAPFVILPHGEVEPSLVAADADTVSLRLTATSHPPALQDGQNHPTHRSYSVYLFSCQPSACKRKQHAADSDTNACQRTGHEDLQSFHLSISSAASITCLAKITVVTDPTPAGTGEMASTMGSTASKFTSPHSIPSSSTLMPTSKMT